MIGPFESWNRSVALTRPRMADLLAASGWAAPRRVFPHSDLLWLTGENVLAQREYVRGSAAIEEARVGLVTLVATASFFAPPARVTMGELVGPNG